MKRFEAEDIVVTYPGADSPVVRGACLSLDSANVYALVGENGAGKTTLARAICALLERDSGRFLVDGREIRVVTPADAERNGIGMVSQKSELAERLTVAENVMLGVEPRIARVFLDRKRMIDRTGDLAREFGFDIDPRSPVVTLSLAERRAVEMLRAAARGARLLILDEPSAQLGPAETESVLAHARAAATTGRIVVYVSHRLDEVARIADRILLMRDGIVRAELGNEGHDADSLARALRDSGQCFASVDGMEIAREGEIDRPGSRPGTVPARGAERGRGAAEAEEGGYAGAGGGPVRRGAVLRCSGVTLERRGGLHGIDLEVSKGELVCVVAVAGQGAEALEEVLTGFAKPDSGTISWEGVAGNGRLAGGGRERAGVRAESFGYVPADRDRRALALAMSATGNAIARGRASFRIRDWAVAAFGRGPGAIRAAARPILGGMPGEEDVSTYSGGMRQSLVIERECAGSPAFVLACNPLQGLDASRRAAALGKFAKLAESGAAVALIVPSIDDAIDSGGRVLVLYRGRLVAASRERGSIEAAMAGGSA